jgi:hypothetical protein
MINEELNKWLAEKVMGWSDMGGYWADEYGLRYWINPEDAECDCEVWNPSESRDQVAMCEEKIPEGKRELYIWKLSRAYDCSIYYITFKIVTASPLQRAEALYKTIEGI